MYYYGSQQVLRIARNGVTLYALFISPAFTGTPAVTGMLTDGETLSLTDDGFTGTDAVQTYAWERRLGSGGTPESAGSGATISGVEGYQFRCTTTITNPGGSDGATTAWTATVGAATFSRVVFIGASIMNDLNPVDDLTERNATFETAFSNEGATVEVFSNAVPAHRADDALATLTAAMAEFPADTLFFVHIGGGDVTAAKPYPGGATALQTDLAALIDQAATRPNSVILGDLTFRDYDDTTAGNESAGSKPYNDGILAPLCDTRRGDLLTRAYYADGTPVVCLYEWSWANRDTFLSADNVHPSAGGITAMQNWLAERLAPICLGAAVPAQVDRTDFSAALENTAGTGTAVFTGTPPVSNAAGTGTATWSEAA